MTGKGSSGIGARTVAGVAWSLSTSVGVRVLQVVGTLMLTHFLNPDDIGEVNNAAIVLISAMRFSQIGIPQYLVTRTEHRREVAWHASIVIIGVTALVVSFAVLLGGPLSVALKAPHMQRYLPGLAVAVFFMGVGVVPERLLKRDLRFKEATLVRTGSELSFTLGSVGGAAFGLGPMSIVLGNILRGLLSMLGMARAMRPREWLTPYAFDRRIIREMMAFGIPFMIAVVMTVVSQTWDNLAMSALYGPAWAGAYGLAYNLADIPATQVGEQVGDVLTPSFVHLDEEQRKSALVRSTSLLSLVVFPLAIGLGAVAETLVSTVLTHAWAQVAPMLTILSVLSVLRPIGWTIGSYLSAQGRTRVMMWIGMLKVLVLFSAMFALGKAFGPLWACAGVGVGFATEAAASIWVVRRLDRIPALAFVRGMLPAVGGGLALTAAVVGARFYVTPHVPDIRGLKLGVEVLAGGVAYLAALLVVAPKTVAEVLRLAKRARRR